jgi:Amt family ammonium transporter
MATIAYPAARAMIFGKGWLMQIGALDFAGVGPVNILPATIGLIGTVILGPRHGIFDSKFNIE